MRQVERIGLLFLVIVGLVRIEEEERMGNVCYGHMGPLHMPIALIGYLVVGLCLVMGLLTI
jgi:hypothetical protein